MNATQLAESGDDKTIPDVPFPEPQAPLTDEELNRMKHAAELVHNMARQPFEEWVYGETAFYCKKEARLILMAMDPHREEGIGERTTGKWLIDCIQKGDADVFRRIAVFVDAWHKEGKTMPSQVSLEQLGIKRRKGRPSAVEGYDNKLSFFASAASEAMSYAVHLRKKPSAKAIREIMDILRKRMNMSKISPSEFSRCVTHFKLNGLLHEEKPGPVKGSTQLNRNKRVR